MLAIMGQRASMRCATACCPAIPYCPGRRRPNTETCTALVTEHRPEGPTEEHLVEELAGIIWRKRRVRMAEAAVYREKIRQKASDYIGPNQVASAALLPLTGASESKASIPQAVRRQPRPPASFARRSVTRV